MERAKDLLKLDHSGRLKGFAYEKEFRSEPAPRDPTVVASEGKWREKLIEGLGINLAEYEKDMEPPEEYGLDL
ncbi:unnamed protein product [Sphagnum balticum]